jgi:MFS family permease
MVGGVVGVMGAVLISPLYALYQQAWQLKACDISLIYVLHMCGGMCALLFLGRLPDRIGFQRVNAVLFAADAGRHADLACAQRLCGICADLWLSVWPV